MDPLTGLRPPAVPRTPPEVRGTAGSRREWQVTGGCAFCQKPYPGLGAIDGWAAFTLPDALWWRRADMPEDVPWGYVVVPAGEYYACGDCAPLVATGKVGHLLGGLSSQGPDHAALMLALVDRLSAPAPLVEHVVRRSGAP